MFSRACGALSYSRTTASHLGLLGSPPAGLQSIDYSHFLSIMNCTLSMCSYVSSFDFGKIPLD